jgi:hypothetical protein
MKDKLRELAAKYADPHCSGGPGPLFIAGMNAAYRAASNDIKAILDAEGDGGAVANSHARMINDFPRLSEFFVKHALGSKLPVSCFACGRVGDRSITHAELADIYVCKVCADKLGAHPARSGVVSDEDVEAACDAYIDHYTAEILSNGAGSDNHHDAMRAALEHFAKGERHER